MYTIKNQSITIVYDEDIISKIKEMIEEGRQKLKSFVKSKTNQTYYKEEQNLDFYFELKERFKNISLKLEELRLCEELRYFLSISHLINYIVYKNSLDASFGHCCFAVDLLQFFIRIFKTNMQFYNDPNENDNFQKVQEEFEKIHFEYVREFYWNIYQPDGEYDEFKMYEFAKSLKG